MIQDLIAAIQGLGGGLQTYSGGIEGLSAIDGQTFADALQGLYGMSQEDGVEPLTAEMFPGIDRSQIEALSGRTYSPLIQTKGQSFLNEMLAAYRKGGARAAGGFAGSGQQQRFGQNIKDVYGKQMSDVLSAVGTSKAKAATSIQDTIDSYKDMALSMRYGI
tara:strand:- start:586 stop:1071 length:486 start_codon:yes stop_codon:yes gene_type:complete